MKIEPEPTKAKGSIEPTTEMLELLAGEKRTRPGFPSLPPGAATDTIVPEPTVRYHQPTDSLELNKDGPPAVFKRILDRQPSSPMEPPKKSRRQSTAMSATADIAEQKRSRISMKTSSAKAKAKGKGKGNAKSKKTKAATGGLCQWGKGKGKGKGKGNTNAQALFFTLTRTHIAIPFPPAPPHTPPPYPPNIPSKCTEDSYEI